MKRAIIKFVIFSLFTTILFSCANTEDNLFEEPASLRLQKSKEKYRKILEEAEQGWILQYFPHPEQRYGGFNFYLKFKDGNVTAQIDGIDLEATSLYSLLDRGGNILSFNLYNPILHNFAQPSGEEPSGKEGDFEFLILSQEGNTINLQGVRTGNLMKLIKVEGTFDEYKKKVESNLSLVNKIVFPVKGSVNGEEIFLKTNEENKLILVKDEKDSAEEGLAYIVTNKGIYFYSPIEINGKKYNELFFDRANKKIYSEDKNVVFEYSLILVDFNANSWNLDISNTQYRSDILKRKWDLDSRKIDLAWGGVFQLSSNYRFGNINGKVGYYMRIFDKNYTEDEGLTMGLGVDFTLDPANPEIVNLKKKKPFNAQLGFIFEHVTGVLNIIFDNAPYSMEVDDEDNATQVKLKSEKNPEVWFILKKV